MKQTYTYFLSFLTVFFAMGCARDTSSVDRSMIALRVARESQERSLKMLEMMSAQAANSATEGKIAESANQEIQQYVAQERKTIETQQQLLAAAEQEVEDFKTGKSTKSQREVVEEINQAVLSSANTIRILEKKTEVIVDFLGNETFSKSEIGALFTPGEYRLIPAQIKEGERLFKPIVDKLYTFADKYKESFKSLKGEIIVTGYSDATAVEKGSKLYQDLAQRLQADNGLESPISADLNQKLSELRALAVKELLNQIISSRKNTDANLLDITVTVLGRGEEIPRGLPTDVSKNDRRRRVVTFYWVVLPSL